MTDQTDLVPLPSLDHDCRTECLADEPDDHIIAVALSNTGEMKTVCTGCLPDMLRNPEFYADETLFGTHLLDEHALSVLFPGEYPELDRELQPRLEHDCRQVCIAEDRNRRMIALTVTEDGIVCTVCTGCVLAILTDPAYPEGGPYGGLTLYGSHILDDEMIRFLWPEDFD